MLSPARTTLFMLQSRFHVFCELEAITSMVTGQNYFVYYSYGVYYELEVITIVITTRHYSMFVGIAVRGTVTVTATATVKMQHHTAMSGWACDLVLNWLYWKLREHPFSDTQSRAHATFFHQQSKDALPPSLEPHTSGSQCLSQRQLFSLNLQVGCQWPEQEFRVSNRDRGGQGTHDQHGNEALSAWAWQRAINITNEMDSWAEFNKVLESWASLLNGWTVWSNLLRNPTSLQTGCYSSKQCCSFSAAASS